MVNNDMFVWVGTINPIVLMLIGILSLCIHFIPSVVAYSRLHSDRLAILILNILLGWTGIGWIILLIWACSSSVPAPLTR